MLSPIMALKVTSAMLSEHIKMSKTFDFFAKNKILDG